MSRICTGTLRYLHAILEQDYEICGNLFVDDSNKCLEPKYIIKGHSGTSFMCQHEKYSKYIFHTHPNIAKGYPSIQDILKVLKSRNNIIRNSLIFTKHGIWNIRKKAGTHYVQNDTTNNGLIGTYRRSERNLVKYVNKMNEQSELDIFELNEYIRRMVKFLHHFGLQMRFDMWDFDNSYNIKK